VGIIICKRDGTHERFAHLIKAMLLKYGNKRMFRFDSDTARFQTELDEELRLNGNIRKSDCEFDVAAIACLKRNGKDRV